MEDQWVGRAEGLGSLEDRRIGWEEGLGSMVLLPRLRTQQGKRGVFHKAGTAFPERAQSCLDPRWTGKMYMHSAVWRGQWYRLMMIEVYRGEVRSSHCPGSRANLFVIGERQYS